MERSVAYKTSSSLHHTTPRHSCSARLPFPASPAASAWRCAPRGSLAPHYRLCPLAAAKGSQNDAAAMGPAPSDIPKVDKKLGDSPSLVNGVDAPTGSLQDPADRSTPSPIGVKTTGLRRAPLSGGVKTATAHFDLPTPQVAVRNLVEQSNGPLGSYPAPHVATRNLVEQAQFGHLCTVMSNMHHRRSGYPFGTLVDFAADGAGNPIFCLSPLAIHARNLMEDPRCSLVVQMPGWTGLANARVTIFGDVYRLPNDMQTAARDIFLQKHNTERKERWVTGNFMYFRMHRIVDIYFVGGFGTVQWIDPQEYHTCNPDAIAMNEPRKTLQVLNDTFAQDLRKLCYPGREADDAAFISIDASGADIRVRHGSEFSVERIGFPNRVFTVDEAMVAVKEAVLQSCQTTLWH